MAAKKDKMIPSEKERKRALKYATPAGTGRMWVAMGIAFIIFGIILLLIPIGLVISEASAQRYDPESIHGHFPEPAPHGMPPEPCHEHPHD